MFFFLKFQQIKQFCAAVVIVKVGFEEVAEMIFTRL